jgi:hypothetical protein
MATTTLTIRDALSDPNLFGEFFEGESWARWRTFLDGLFGLPMTDDELAIWQHHTGRERAPESAFREAFVVVGRRGGKSRTSAAVAVFLACFQDYSDVLSPGEQGEVMLLAPDRRQARVEFRYVESLIDGSPLLRSMVKSRTKETIELRNNITISVHTSNFRAIRGYTVVAAILDEVAFFRSDDSANPDVEILNALRPSMATIPTGLLLCISSPYSRRGVLWDAYERYWGEDHPDVLVWQGTSREMNGTIPSWVIERALEQDHSAARAEYFAEFRRDLEAFVSREAVDGCTYPGRYELGWIQQYSYSAFVDPSGGSRDSFTLAVAHQEGDRAVIDAVREVRAPFVPEKAVEQLVPVLQSYGIRRVHGDRYGGQWPAEAFKKRGIAYTPSEKTKSDLYQDLLPRLNSGQVELLDVPVLRNQLLGLERRTSRSGRDSIDHAPGGRDDVANACAGVVSLCSQPARMLKVGYLSL